MKVLTLTDDEFETVLQCVQAGLQSEVLGEYDHLTGSVLVESALEHCTRSRFAEAAVVMKAVAAQQGVLLSEDFSSDALAMLCERSALALRAVLNAKDVAS